MKTKIILLITILSLTAFKNAERSLWEKVTKTELQSAFEQSSAWFMNTKKYRIKIRYATYKDHFTPVAHEKESGFFERSGDCFRSSVFGIVTIQNNEMRMTIDSINEIIILNNKSAVSQPPIELGSFPRILDAAKSLKKEKKEDVTKYKIEFNPNKLYDAYEFEVDKNGMMLHLSYYFSSPVKEDEEDKKATGSKPRAEIFFSDYQTQITLSVEKEFSCKKYFRSEGKKIILTDKYKNYELKDLRFSK